MAPPSLKLVIALAMLAASTMAVWPPNAIVVAQYSPQDYVDAHNRARAHVGVGPVEWDDDVAQYAKQYAGKRLYDCQLRVSRGSYGENLYWGAWGTDWTAVDAVEKWVEQGKYYDYDTNKCVNGGRKCYVYTQVVWRASTRIGCARVECDNHGGVFIICNYHPAGNVPGEKPY